MRRPIVPLVPLMASSLGRDWSRRRAQLRDTPAWRPCLRFAVGLSFAGFFALPFGYAADETEGTIRTPDGESLHFYVQGRSPDTVVVIHGGPGLGSGTLRPDLPQLSNAFTVIHYDQRGGGRSGPVADTASVTLAHHVEDLELLRRHFRLERLHLFAHSFGGAVALGYHARYPARVASLVFVDILPPRSYPYDGAFVRQRDARIPDSVRLGLDELMLRMTVGPDPVGACTEFFAILRTANFYEAATFRKSRANSCEGGEDVITTYFARSRVTMQSYRTINGRGYDFRRQAMNIRARTLVVHGAADPLPARAAAEWAASIRGSCLVFIERAGHYPYLEQPEVFFPLVDRFYRSSPIDCVDPQPLVAAPLK